MEFRTISGGGQPFVVSQEGEGQDIVLVHGFPDTPHSFADLQGELVRAGWRVTVPWLRGYHADTIVPGRPYDFETLGRDGLALLDAIGAPRAVVVGHDWGALVAFVMATLAPERTRAIVTIAIPHPSVLKRTPASLFAARHFIELKLPWAARSVKRGDFAYLDKLYRRWAPNWSDPARDACLREIKQALSSDATLNGAIDYYRALPLGGSRLLDQPPAVKNLAVAGTADIVDAELFSSTPELFPAPSRALIVEGAGHWPHREQPTPVLGEIVSFAAAL